MGRIAAVIPEIEPARTVLLVELNEINWQVIDDLLRERGASFLPTIAHLKREGTWGAPAALEKPPLLDPWVTWVTVHTGVPHGARVLEQDACDVRAKRSWEYAADAGLSIGVFGSIGAHPPRKVDGFIVPGPFAPSNATYPLSSEPIQALNRGHTQAHGGSGNGQSIVEMASSAARLMRHGLRVSTCARVLSFASELSNSRSKWRRVTLQPLINFDFFESLYRKHKPAYATWHSNHAAHFMHHYWRAWRGDAFVTKGSDEERQIYGEAVPFGYKVCDELLARFIDGPPRLLGDSRHPALEQGRRLEGEVLAQVAVEGRWCRRAPRRPGTDTAETSGTSRCPSRRSGCR